MLCGGRALTRVPVVAVLKQSLSSLSCCQLWGMPGDQGAEPRALPPGSDRARCWAFCFSDRLKYESKKSKSASVAVSNDFGFSSVLSGNFQDAREHHLPAAPVFPALCPAASGVSVGGGNWCVTPCCPPCPSTGEELELVGDGAGCCCPPYMEMLLLLASVQPWELGSIPREDKALPCLGRDAGLCLRGIMTVPG